MTIKADMELARRCLETAKQKGAESARICLTRSREDIISTLNGQVDKVTGCEDSSAILSIFADSRYGSFSTNKLDDASLEKFIENAVELTKTLTPDPLRKLPDPQRCCHTAPDGTETGLYDSAYESVTPERRVCNALEAAVSKNGEFPEVQGCRIISEEGEYSDSVTDTITADTQGLECRHTETSFDYWVEITVQSEDGDKLSGYWWDSSPRLNGLDAAGCGKKALENAIAQIGSEAVKSGKYNLVVDSEAASKMVSPLLNALNGYSLQQHNSFLEGSLGKKIFPEGLTLSDVPHIFGETGSKLFDSEGVSTSECDIIEKGTIKRYSLNTYMSGKLGMKPTVEEATRPYVKPWPEECGGRDEIVKKCGDGILVTEFNGGNCNTATGDFSYGIQGFLFKNGTLVKPVSEMLITGNFLTLWNSLLYCGSDSRRCKIKLIPTLAFKDVDFSGE